MSICLRNYRITQEECVCSLEEGVYTGLVSGPVQFAILRLQGVRQQCLQYLGQGLSRQGEGQTVSGTWPEAFLLSKKEGEEVGLEQPVQTQFRPVDPIEDQLEAGIEAASECWSAVAPLTAIVHAQPKLSRTPVDGVVTRLRWPGSCWWCSHRSAAHYKHSVLPSLPIAEQYEVMEVGGGLKQYTNYWRNIDPDLWVLNLVTNGYKLEFTSKPSRVLYNSSNSTTGRQSSPEFSAKSSQGTFRGKSHIPNMTSLSSGLWPTFLATKKTREGRPILILKLLSAFVKPKSSERRRSMPCSSLQ